MRLLVPAVLGIVLGGSLISACGTDRSGPAGSADPPLPVFDFEEELRIDGYAADLVPIDTVIRVAVARNGTIAIAQRQSYEVRFFSESGEPLGRIGRQGEGPGEFTQAQRLGWLADTLYVYDFSQRRFTLIDPELRYVRYIYVPGGARPGPELADRVPAFSVVYGAALYEDGSVFGELGGPQDRNIGEYDPSMPTYGRVAEDGRILHYFQFPTGAGERITIPTDQGTFLLSTSVFPVGRPIIRISDDGSRLVRLTVAMEGPDAGTYEVLVEDKDGQPLYRRRYPFDPVAITSAMQDSIVEARVASMPPEMAGPYRRGATFPPMLPPVVGFVHGRDHTLWIRLRDTEAGRPYRVLSPEGEPLGSITLPLDSRIAVADLDHIWVIERDEWGMESLLRYRVMASDEG